MKNKIFTLSIMMFFTVLVYGQKSIKKQIKINFREEIKCQEYHGKMDASSLNVKSKKLNLSALNHHAKERLDNYEEQVWNADIEGWENSYKSEFTYNEDGKLLENVSKEWDDVFEDWINSTKMEYTYNEKGEIITEINSIWDSTDEEWINNQKFESNYDTNGNRKTYTIYNWNNTLSIWNNNLKEEEKHDEFGNDTLLILMEWEENSNSWVNFFKTEFLIDSNSRKTSSVESLWDKVTNKWENAYKSDYIYDSNGNLLEKTVSEWDSDLILWFFSDKQEYTYNLNQKPEELTESIWNRDLNQWDLSLKSQYKFDSNGNPVEEKYSKWNAITIEWDFSTKYEHLYDLNITKEELLIPSLSDFFPDYRDFIFNKPLEVLSFDYLDSKWKSYNKVNYYYTALDDLSVNHVNSIEIKVFPNPTSGEIYFRFEKEIKEAVFDMFDIKGRKVLSKKIIKDQKMNISDFDTGIYFYNIKLDDKIFSGKIIIE